VAAFRRNSREIVDGERRSRRAISRTPSLRARSKAICSRSTNDKYRPDVGGDDGARCDGGIPPHSRNHLEPTAGDTPAFCAASSLENPSAIACQNGRRSDRCSTGGRPGDRIFARPARSAPRFPVPINTSDQEVLRQRVEFTQYTSEHFQKLLKEQGITCSISRAGEVWDNSAMESFFSSLKTERTARKVFRTRQQARAEVFDYVERFYNPTRRHSTLGYVSPIAFEKAREA
jgi:putative transposase